MAKKLLVVEDNDLNRKLFCDLLRAHDFEPEPLGDGRDALKMAQSKAPDLIIMDIQMPHVSGLDLIDTFKKDTDLKTSRLRPSPLIPPKAGPKAMSPGRYRS